jgi:hypothetical protein
LNHTCVHVNLEHPGWAARSKVRDTLASERLRLRLPLSHCKPFRIPALELEAMPRP